MAVLVRRAIRLRGQFAYTRADFARAVEILAEGDLASTGSRTRRSPTGAEAFANLVDRPAEYAKVLLSPVMSEPALPRHRRVRLHRRLGGARARRATASASSPSTSRPTRGGSRCCSDAEQLAAVPHVAGDISDLDAVERALDEHGITNVIHLAALQVPFCRADPPLGARVNVLGTVNVFEAVRRRRDRMAPVVYASSIAAFDAPEEAPEPSMSGHPGTIYGVYKRANESTASVYRAENGVPSVGLRPHTVYGVGRDQGLTSAPTTAMLAAAAGVPYTIPYGGAASSSSRATSRVRSSPRSLSGHDGATVHNLPGPRVTIAEVIDAIAEAVPGASIGFDDAGCRSPRRSTRARSPSSSRASPRRRSPRASLDDRALPLAPRRRALLTPQRPRRRDEQRRACARLWADRFGRPDPKIVCVGLNYAAHAGESGGEPPKAPLLFGKFANTLLWDGDPIVLPPGVGHVDAEAELAVVIGETRERACRRRARWT